MIEPVKIITYIKSMGWEHKHTTRVESLVFVHKEYKDSILIPTDATLGDYEDLINDAVQRIADIEKTTVAKVKENIDFILNDIIRFRSDSPLANNGTLPLRAWEKHFDFTIRSIKVASSCIFKPTSSGKRLKPKDAASFASRCRIGQTEFGSYITKAMIPLGDYQRSIHLENEAAKEPHGRQLSTAIAIGAHIVANASKDIHEHGKTDEFQKFDENKPLALICERMCSAFEDASVAFNDKLELSILLTPSPELPNVQINLQSPAVFSSRLISEIRAIKKIIAHDFIPKRLNITGFVTGLNQDTYKNDIDDGWIVLFDSARRKIHAKLDEEMYNTAIEAHRSKRPVSITGTINKEKRKYYLADPSDVVIL